MINHPHKELDMTKILTALALTAALVLGGAGAADARKPRSPNRLVQVPVIEWPPLPCDPACVPVEVEDPPLPCDPACGTPVKGRR